MTHQQLEQSAIVKSILGNSLFIDLGANQESQSRVLTEQALTPEFLKPILAGESISLEPKAEEKGVTVHDSQADQVVDLSVPPQARSTEKPKRILTSLKGAYRLIKIVGSKRNNEKIGISDEAHIVNFTAESSSVKLNQARFTFAQLALVSLTSVTLASLAYFTHLHFRDFKVLTSEVRVNNKGVERSPVEDTKPNLNIAKAEEREAAPNKPGVDTQSFESRVADASPKEEVSSPPITVKVVSGAFVPVEPPRVELPKPLPAQGSQLSAPVEKMAIGKPSVPVAMPSTVGAQQLPNKGSTGNTANSPADGKESKPGPLVLDDTSKEDRERIVQKSGAVKVVSQPISVPAQVQSKSVAQPVKDVPTIDASAKNVSTSKSPSVTVVDVPKDGKSVMVTNPANRLPMRLVVGERLPNGKVIQSINGVGGYILTTDGVTYSMD